MSLSLVYAGIDGERLDKVLMALLSKEPALEGVSRSQIKNWIESGSVKLNGNVAKKAGVEVHKGACIEVDVPEASSLALAPYDFPINILYEDESLLVIDKPAGLSMHPGAGNKTQTLVNALLFHFQKSSNGNLPEVLLAHDAAVVAIEGKPKSEEDEDFEADDGVVAQSVAAAQRPGIVHRLDKDTTGVVVVAKTLQAHSSLSRQFAERTVGRAYQALVFSTPRAKRAVSIEESGRVEASIGRNPVRRKEMAVCQQGGRKAATNWKVVERMNYACLVQLKLETGRTHQIRVHMNHIGSPVIGDRVYGNFSGLPAALKKTHEEFGRQALHAFLLEFSHPKTGERLSFSSELPQDMKCLIDVFRGFKG